MGRELAKKPPLFFLAVLPPAKIRDEVTAFKEYARKHFRSGRALRSPPHITLIPPFHWKKPEEELHRDCASLASLISRPGLLIRLRDFEAFPPRVIFVDVEPDPQLAGLHKSMMDFARRTWGVFPDEKRPFHPHVTVAFKDLSRSRFEEAWAYFSTLAYRRSFPADSFWLLKHGQGGWKLVDEFPWVPASPTRHQNPLSP